MEQKGDLTISVFDDKKNELGHTNIGENLTFHYNGNNPYTIVSEKYLAETMFNNWMNSEGHKQLMENGVYTGFSFAVYPVMNGNTKASDKKDGGGYENYRDASEYSGIGILGALTVMTHP